MAIPSKRVAVIGAGISGVVAAAHLRKEGIDVTVFERSSAAGGIWLYDERRPLEPLYSPLPVSKIAVGDETSQTEDVESLIHAPPGPCYAGLKNNVSTPLLETTLNQFPAGTEDYVSHSVLKDYIQDTAAKHGVQGVTQYNTEAQQVVKSGRKWEVATVHLERDGKERFIRTENTSKFDAVLVASGHYHAPKVPTTPGLAEWRKRWPDRVQHSKGYRTPEHTNGKNILLVGGSVSSTDIAREISPFAKQIYQSQRNGAFDLSAALLPDNACRIDEVASYDVLEETSTSSLMPTDPIPATITLKSGRKLTNIHEVILCTGYHLTLPFLPQYHSDGTLADQANEKILVSDGSQFHNLHKDIFYIEDPSLLFIGVPFFTATFTLFEFQAIAAAQVLSGKVKLPPHDSIRSEYDAKVQAKGYGKAFHSLRDKEEEYVNELLAWVNHERAQSQEEKFLGHTERWKNARLALVERIRALYATPSTENPATVPCF